MKELQEQKSVLARSIAAEQKKVEQLEADKSTMAKQADELKTELNNLRALKPMIYKLPTTPSRKLMMRWRRNIKNIAKKLNVIYSLFA